MTAAALDQLDQVDLLDLDRWAREGPPFAAFARLSRDAPVHWHPTRGNDTGFWVVTGYDEVVQLGRRTDALSSDADHGGVFGLGPGDEMQQAFDRFADRIRRWARQGLSDQLRDLPPDVVSAEAKQLLTMDPPEHTAHRRMVNSAFTPRTVAALRPSVEREVGEILDRVGTDRAFDAVTELAMPVPLHVIADMLGVPAEERPLVRSWTDRLVGGTDPEYRAGTRTELKALVGLSRYIAGLRSRPREVAAENLVTTLLDARHAGRELSLVRFISLVLLLAIAGNETTRAAISHGVLELARHPGQLRRLAAQPELVPTAVDEILRWASPVMYLRRNVTAEIEVAGRTLRRGDLVSLWFIAANRSARHFVDPDHFDVTRDPNPHLAFGGGGPHYCLGASLARMELEVVVRELVRRADRIELAGEPERLRSNFLNGIKHLPVVLRPR